NCLLIGARGFLGSHIKRLLRDSNIDVIGTTRTVADGDPSAWIQYTFPDESIESRIGGVRFDFVIIAAKLAQANIAAKPAPGGAACWFDWLFSELSRVTRSSVTYLSSDAVFSGARGGYVETDEPDAAETYGSMQAIVERSLSEHLPHHLILRPSFLFDINDF